MSAQAFCPVPRFLDSTSNAWLRLLDSLHLVIQIFQKKMGILLAQASEFHICLMVLGSNPQGSFLEHRLLEEQASWEHWEVLILWNIFNFGECAAMTV